jgi:hypothetical protein
MQAELSRRESTVGASTAQAASRPWGAVRGLARFVLHFVEMWVAMVVGMIAFHGLVYAYGNEAVQDPTSEVHLIGMMVSMTVPMVAWMRLRGHGWQHGLEMAVGMLAPVVVIFVLLSLGAGAALPWLLPASVPAMALGMVAAMLLRREHYAGGHRTPSR